MNTKFLMIASAFFMGLLGACASFLPQETLAYWGTPADESLVVLVQITGALYLGFAVLNWMARGNAIGGIYSRPVALGNFLHFGVVAILLAKQLVTAPITAVLAVGAGAYAVFAAAFGYLVFGGGATSASGASCG